MAAQALVVMDVRSACLVVLLSGFFLDSVRSEAPQIGRVNVPQNLEEGQRFRLSCEIVRGSLPISFVWLRNSLPFVPSGGVRIVRVDDFQEQLQIPKLSADHLGNYSCLVKNIHGSDQITAQVLMKYAPRWNVAADERAIHSMTGANVTIDCSARGHPEPTIEVMRGGHKVRFSESFRVQNGQVEINAAAGQNLEQFSCVASNALGRIEKLIKVSLSGKSYRLTQASAFATICLRESRSTLRWFPDDGDLVHFLSKEG